MTDELENIEDDVLPFWLMLIIMISIVFIIFIFYSVFFKTSEYSSITQPSEYNILDDYYEKCTKYEIITYDRFIIKIGEEPDDVVGLEYTYNPKSWDRPTFEDVYKLDSTHNETKCIEYMLVRDAKK